MLSLWIGVDTYCSDISGFGAEGGGSESLDMVLRGELELLRTILVNLDRLWVEKSEAYQGLPRV